MKRNRLILLAAFILSLAGISFYGGPVTWIFFWLVIFVPVISLFYTFCVMLSIKIYQKTDGRNMVSGAPSDFYVTLQNEGWFSFASFRVIFYSSFSTVMGMEDDAVYELSPHSSIKKKTRLLCRYRGNYNVGVKSIVVTDFFGLFSLSRRIKEPLNVIVAPAVIHIEKIGEDENKKDSRLDNEINKTEMSIPVHEYAEGDDPRLINWKASAVMQKLMVREKTGQEEGGMAIIMDPHRRDPKPEGYLPSENKVIETVLALSLYYADNAVPVDAFYMNENVVKRSVRNRADFEMLYEEMLHYSFREERNAESFFAKLYEGVHLSEARKLIFVLQGYEAKTAEWIERINVGRLPVAVYLIDDKTDTSMEDIDRDVSIVSIGAKDVLSEVLL